MPVSGGSKKDSNIQFVRSVPKFLQGHMHLLGRKLPQEEEEAQLASMDEEKDGAASDDEKVPSMSPLLWLLCEGLPVAQRQEGLLPQSCHAKPINVCFSVNVTSVLLTKQFCRRRGGTREKILKFGAPDSFSV